MQVSYIQVRIFNFNPSLHEYRFIERRAGGGPGHRRQEEAVEATPHALLLHAVRLAA
jgi:hypothetical protein